MKPNLGISLLALQLLLAASVQAAEESDERQLQAKQTPPVVTGHRGRKQLMMENAEGATITLWKPDLTTQVLQPVHATLTIPPTGMDNYHALVAEKMWPDSKEVLIRYEYLFGRPSNHSPSELAGAMKTELEIVPAPIPREHFRYHSDQSWGFQVRLQGQPLAALPLILETENGSHLEAVTDNSGYARFHLPDDFPDVEAGIRDRRSAEFTVTATTELDGTAYQTMLTATYRLNPSHWQSSPLGWFVVGLGFIAGGLIARQNGRGGCKA
jgi:hypothetical protein